jgi:predicted permease
MDQFIQDFRFALRTLATRRAFSVIAIVTLALGIGITTAIFSVVNGILLRPLPFHDADRIVTVWETDKKDPQPVGELSHLAYLDVLKQTKSFESFAEYAAGTGTLTGNGPASVVSEAYATPGFFHVFRATPVLGREFTDAEDRPNGPKVVVIGYSFWKQRLGGKPDVIGTSLEIASTKYTIVGVAPEKFDFPDKAQVWTPPQNDDAGCGRGCVYMTSVGRLANGVSVEAAQQELTAFAEGLEKLYPKSNAGSTLRVSTLQHSIVGDVQTALLVLMGAVAMVLLIACANVANLLLVRGAARRAELAVRSVLGAVRGRILAQLMTENLVLAAIGGIAGVVLASYAVDALRHIAPTSIPRTADVGLDATTTLFAIGLVIATAILFGLAPAMQLSRQSLGTSMREAGRGSDGSPRRLTRSAILVAEVALSVVLLLGAGLMLRSFAKLTKVDMGFDPANVTTFTVSLPNARYATPDAHVLAMEQLTAKLAATPGVESIGTVAGLPLGNIRFGSGFRRMDLPEPEPNNGPTARFAVADAGYLSTMHIGIAKGRDFSRADRQGAAPVALISEATAAKYYPGEDPIGKRIHVGVGLGYPNKGVERTIVGIVKDVRGDNISDTPQPALYVPFSQTGNDFTSFVIRSHLPSAQVLSDARAVVNAFDSDIALEYESSMEQLVDAQLATPRFYLALISLFAVLAAVLAAVGIYGVVSFLVANRTREIGLRMALGAPGRRVVGLVVWQGLRPALLGVAIGLAGALASVKLLSSLLYGVAPHDIVTYTGVTALLVAVVLVACAVPAYRASRIAPGIALRSD